MSGGVDSAVAAARMLDAGHEVVGVHLALSRSAADAARVGAAAAARSRTRATPAASPTCSASRSTSGTWPSASTATSSRTSWRSTPRAAPPTRACAATRRSSSPPCSTRPSPSASTPSRTGHYAQVVEAPDGHRELHRAVDMAKDQSLRPRCPDPGPARPGLLPARRHDEAADPGRGGGARLLRRAEARQPRHLLHPRRRHPGLARPRRSASRPATSSTPTAPSWASHAGAYAYTVGQRRGLGLSRPAADGEPRYVVEVRPADQPGRRRHGRPARGQRPLRRPRALVRPGARGRGRVGAQVRAHGEEFPATARADGDGVEVRLDERIRGVAPGQSVVLYDGTRVVGSATITASRLERVQVRVRADGSKPSDR